MTDVVDPKTVKRAGDDPAATAEQTLDVTVLGCSGSYAEAGGSCSGYLVRGGGRTVLLDCGPGSLANLQRHIDISELDAVVITHCHPDHWTELPVLRNVWKWVLRTERRLPVITTEETWHMADVVSGDRLLDTCEPTIVSDGAEHTIGPQRWRFSRTDHPVETLAVRVDVSGRSFAFSADTGPDWSLEALAFDGGIDLAFVESTYSDATKPRGVQHLTAAQAGAIAAAANVRHLVLTHLLPGQDPATHRAEARTSFDGSLSVATIHRGYRA
ncbi:MAG TPA: MBL fold metallo-hydrolase [Acidimicrobiales bacterium]